LGGIAAYVWQPPMRDGQGYADSPFAAKAILSRPQIKARTQTVSKFRKKAETSTYRIKG
jgi:hypothetical protein